MTSKVLVSDIAAKAGATDEDVRTLDTLWQQMIRIDTDGSYYVDSTNQNYLWGALYSTAEKRRGARIQAADTRLVQAHAALKATAAPKGNTGQTAWQSQMLDRFAEVRDALVELCDAKVDAKAMTPALAESLRAQADRVLRDAGRNAIRAARQLHALTRDV